MGSIKKITPKEKKRFEKELDEYLVELEAVAEVKKRTAADGDFSENEPYQKAKVDMSRINLAILELRAKLEYEIEDRVSNTIGLNSNLEIVISNEDRSVELFRYVVTVCGSDDLTPLDGFISINSPLIRELQDLPSPVSKMRYNTEGTYVHYLVTILD